MMQKILWNNDAQPINSSIARVLYELQYDDMNEGYLFDALRVQDIERAADQVLAFDALVADYNKLERKMHIMGRQLNAAGKALTLANEKPQITQPFTKNGTANVAAIFELSDGQTISVFFHNPDITPKKIQPTDVLVSWKWLLNKKDVTIVVAPEKGQDLNVREVAKRIMALAEKNSAAFVRKNAKRAEQAAQQKALEDEIAQLEIELKAVQNELKDAENEMEDAKKQFNASPKEQEVNPDPVKTTPVSPPQKRTKTNPMDFSINTKRGSLKELMESFGDRLTIQYMH